MKKTANKKQWMAGIGCMGVILLAIGIVIFLFFGSESGKRTIKGWQSDYGDGLERQVTIYSETGEILYEDEGRFDIEVSETRVKYIDENGKLQLIYLGNSATAIVIEK